MYEFYYEYLKQKYGKKVKLCYMDRDSFIVHIQTEDFYKDISNDVNEWFDTSKNSKEDNRPLPIGINKKVLSKFKDELDGKVMTEFCAPRAKTYAFAWGDDKETKKAKGTKKCVIKKHLKLEDYKRSVFNNEDILRLQLRFKGDHHVVYMEEINKVAISSNDDKRVQTFDRVTTYQYGTNAFKIFELEMLPGKKEIPIKMYY